MLETLRLILLHALYTSEILVPIFYEYLNRNLCKCILLFALYQFLLIILLCIIF